MSGYDFYVNSEELYNLKAELAAKITAIEASLEGLEASVTGMSGKDGWESDVYNILNEKFTTKKESLQYAITYLKAYEATLGLVAEKAETLSTQISSACSI